MQEYHLKVTIRLIIIIISEYIVLNGFKSVHTICTRYKNDEELNGTCVYSTNQPKPLYSPSRNETTIVRAGKHNHEKKKKKNQIKRTTQIKQNQPKTKIQTKTTSFK